MANISQEVNIEMLEKLTDGSYKKKNPSTKASQVIANDGSNLETHLAESTQQAHLAKNIGLEDVEGKFTATELEGAMSELFTNVSDGKDLVGGAITDVDESVVIPADPTFGDLVSAIGGISTGKKWASGSGITDGSTRIIITDLDFEPSIVIANISGGVRGTFYSKNMALHHNFGGSLAIDRSFAVMNPNNTGYYGGFNVGFDPWDNYKYQECSWIAYE